MFRIFTIGSSTLGGGLDASSALARQTTRLLTATLACAWCASAVAQPVPPSPAPQTASKPASAAVAAATSTTNTATHAASTSLQADFDRFVAWFGGEYNNNEQVWQQGLDVKAGKTDAVTLDKMSHTHHIFAPVDAPKLGRTIYYVQQSLDGDLSKLYRQRVYRLSIDEKENAIRLEILTPLDEKSLVDAHKRPDLFKTIESTAFRHTAGCDVFWRYDATNKSFEGTMKAGACAFDSKRYNKKVVITDTLKLTDSELWINDQARDEQGGYVFGSKTNTPVKARKVRYFTGWVWLHRDGPTGDVADRKRFSFRRDVMIHDEGQKIPMLYDDGTESPYLLELAQLTYQNTRTSILKMAVIDKATGKNVFYIWAQPDGTRVGINHGWIQVGLTQKTSRIAYGFGDPPSPAASSTTNPASRTAAPATN
jgi:hypothetical protein